MTDPPLLHPGSAGTPERPGGQSSPAPAAGGRLSLGHLPGNRVSLCPHCPRGARGPAARATQSCGPVKAKTWPLIDKWSIEASRQRQPRALLSIGPSVAGQAPTNARPCLQAFPSLSSRDQAWGPPLWEAGDPEAGQAGGLDSSWETRPASGSASSLSGPWHWVMAEPPPRQSGLADRSLGSSVLRNNLLHRSRGQRAGLGTPGLRPRPALEPWATRGPACLLRSPGDLGVQTAHQAESGHLDFREDALSAPKPWGPKTGVHQGLRCVQKSVTLPCFSSESPVIILILGPQSPSVN